MKFRGNEYNRIWFSSDLHFGHPNILKFCPETRQWPTIQKADEGLIEYHNQTVGPDDLLIHTGDFSFHGPEVTRVILNELQGSQVMILGNHDRKNERLGAFQNCVDVLPDFFGTIEGQYFHIYHFPIWEWDKMHRGSLHLYGHVHGKETNIPGRCMDVGWDAHGRYLPVEEVIETLLKKEVRKH